MAYSDYGAFIWKNGENVTKEFADTGFSYNKEKKEWLKSEIYEDDTIHAGGHAVLKLKDFCIEFYKCLEPYLVYKTGKKIKLKILEYYDEYQNTKLNLKISGYSIGHNKTINMFHIEHNKDFYTVICGAQVGNGYENTKVSKWILKNIKFYKNKDFSYFNNVYDLDAMIDNLNRKDDLKFARYLRWEFGIKLLLRDIIKFKFKSILWDLDQITEYNSRIKCFK